MKPYTFTRTLVFILFACAIATLSSCVKSKDEKLAVTKDNLAGTYMLTSIRGKDAGQTEQDLMSYYFPNACEQDDELVLKSNMTFDVIDAGTQCNNGGYSSTWNLVAGDVFIDTIFGTVESLTSKELVIRYTEGNSYIVFYLARK